MTGNTEHRDRLSDSAWLVHQNERRWRLFRARVAQFVGSRRAAASTAG
jgi:hypothetical protein